MGGYGTTAQDGRWMAHGVCLLPWTQDDGCAMGQRQKVYLYWKTIAIPMFHNTLYFSINLHKQQRQLIIIAIFK